MARGKHQLDLQDMKTFLYLLHRSYNESADAGIQSVPVAELLNYLGHTSIKLMHRSLKNLGSVKIDIDYREGDDEHSVSCHFLSYDVSRTSNGMLEYAFDPILMRFIFEPQIYGKINMSLFSHFKTTHGAKLYEIMTLFKNRFHRTWTVPVDEFRDRFGIGTDQYCRFDNLKRHVIEKAVKEVNRIAPFGIDVSYIRGGKGGKVETLRFTVIPRTELPSEAVATGNDPIPRGRDPKTVDMLTGQTDEENTLNLTVSDEALEEAVFIMSSNGTDEGELERYLDDWRASVAGQRVTDPGVNFLRWLRLKFSTRKETEMEQLDDSVIDSILAEYE
ncbi:Initiator RepB protein [Salipiger mucosus DSM 16094]|uniref:Initiator RepB protein n=2 Tax=Salipiger mucosus TaxID=263378 RepID=S9QVG7_9RHOB|nr:Initiator RepB protein [Salipiger mucosus DSM 16094]